MNCHDVKLSSETCISKGSRDPAFGYAGHTEHPKQRFVDKSWRQVSSKLAGPRELQDALCHKFLHLKYHNSQSSIIHQNQGRVQHWIALQVCDANLEGDTESLYCVQCPAMISHSVIQVIFTATSLLMGLCRDSCRDGSLQFPSRGTTQTRWLLWSESICNGIELTGGFLWERPRCQRTISQDRVKEICLQRSWKLVYRVQLREILMSLAAETETLIFKRFRWGMYTASAKLQVECVCMAKIAALTDF